MDNHRLTKKEKYFLKKQQKEQNHLRKIRRQRIRKIIFISLPIVLVISGITFGLISYLSKDSQGRNQGTPKIEFTLEEYDVGAISMADGLVKHTFEIQNNGDGDLKIDRIWTSCMCTTARLKTGDRTSPEFDMHSNPKFWSQTIAPGETGDLMVVFDPAFHGPAGTGLMVRVIYLSTNDPVRQKAEVKLIAQVVE